MQRELAAERLVAADPLVVVQEVAAAVEDQLVAVDLDPLGVVRGVAVHDVDPGVDRARARSGARAAGIA